MNARLPQTTETDRHRGRVINTESVHGWQHQNLHPNDRFAPEVYPLYAHGPRMTGHLGTLVPGRRVRCALARSLQPDSVPHKDAVFNVSRSALLVAALIQSPELLLAATEDRLHQTYRASAMPETDRLITALRSADYPAVVSGAGPSILVLGSDPSQRLSAADLVAREADTPWQALMLAVDFKGATRTVS